jgi:enoyl-CoA hydratase
MDDGKANALSDAMLGALLESLLRAEKEAKAAVLVGRPDRFCAGFDLRTMMAGPDAATALLRRGVDVMMKLYALEIPLVVACTGHALAGGALVVLTGDVRIGAAGAYRIGLNEVSIGIPVPLLALAFARDRILPTELVSATLLSKIYAPDEAARVGWLDEVVPAGDVLARAKVEAERVGALAQPAFRQTKSRLRGATIAHIMATLDADMKAITSGI